LLECGETARAVATAREHLQYALSTGGSLNELSSQVELASVLALSNGDAAEAQASLVRASDLAEQLGIRAFEPGLHEIAASLHARLGEDEACSRELRVALQGYQALGASGHAQRVARALALRA